MTDFLLFGDFAAKTSAEMRIALQQNAIYRDKYENARINLVVREKEAVMRKPSPERIERKISAAASIAMCVLVVGVQIAFSILLSRFLHAYYSYIYGALELIAASFAVWIYTRHGSPSYKLSWMCLLLLLPVGKVKFLHMRNSKTAYAKVKSLRDEIFATRWQKC